MRARRCFARARTRALRPPRWLIWGLLLVGALGVGLCCVQREPEPPAPAASTAGNEPAPTLEAEPPTAPTQPDDDAPALQEAAEPQAMADEEPAHDSPLNPVAQFMRNSDKHDRELLATVERETRKSPSPEVMELLALRRSGASQGEIERFIDAELASDIRVRAAARRWLRESSGAEPPATSPQPGQGGTDRAVQPIAPR